MIRALAHASGVGGALLIVLLIGGLFVPPAERFPDSLVVAFHTFFVGTLRSQEGLPTENDPDWVSEAEPGDVIFVSRGRVAWGQWSHVAVVVRAFRRG